MQVAKLTILGVGSARPTHQQCPTAQYLEMTDKAFLIDCGEGAQLTMKQMGLSSSRLYNIFISHLHGDHVFGLIGLLSTLSMQKRLQPMHIYAHADLEKLLRPWLEYHCADMSYEVIFHAIHPRKNAVIYEDRTVEVQTIPLRHKVPTCGFLFVEKHRVPDTENGGFRIERRKRYAFCSDTAYSEKIVPIIQGVDMLYHETTYTTGGEARARQVMHSTAQQAATIARMAEVGQLLTGHYSAREEDHSVFLDEAAAVFPRTILGEERKRYEF